MHTLTKLIELQRLNVAIENAETRSFRDLFAANFGELLFNNLRKRIAEIFTDRKTTHYSWTPRIEQSLIDWANKESYMILGDVTVFVPAGLKVSYLGYLDALEGVLPNILKIEEELLDPTLETIGVLINNPVLAASKSGLTGSAFNGKLFGIHPSDTAKTISACFDANSRDDTMVYKKAVRNNAELKVVAERLAQLQDNLPMGLSARVEKKIKQVVDLVDALNEQIKVDERYKALSPRIGNLVSDKLYQAALWVEWFAVYQRQVLVLSTALEDTTKKLKKLAKK